LLLGAKLEHEIDHLHRYYGTSLACSSAASSDSRLTSCFRRLIQLWVYCHCRFRQRHLRHA
jgi:hypothetical protein